MGKNKLAKFADLNTFGHVIQLSYKELLKGTICIKRQLEQ